MQRSHHHHFVSSTLTCSLATSAIALFLFAGAHPADAQSHTSATTASERFVPSEEDPTLAEAKRAVRLRDFEKAVGLWRKAARRGSPRAQYRLGVSYRSGRGVEQDNVKAAFWFSKAAPVLP